MSDKRMRIVYTGCFKKSLDSELYSLSKRKSQSIDERIAQKYRVYLTYVTLLMINIPGLGLGSQ